MKSTFDNYNDAIMFIALSIMEAQNPNSGWSEIMAVIGSSEVLKLVRLMPGLTIRIPTMKELSRDMHAALYIYHQYTDKITDDTFKLRYGIDDNIKILKARARDWQKFMEKNNIDPEMFFRRTMLVSKE